MANTEPKTEVVALTAQAQGIASGVLAPSAVSPAWNGMPMRKPSGPKTPRATSRRAGKAAAPLLKQNASHQKERYDDLGYIKQIH